MCYYLAVMGRVKHILTLLFLLGFAGELAAGGLPWARDLEADARQSRERNVPIMVMFTSESCPWCEVVMEDYIGPMARDPRYESKVIVRVVEVQGIRRLVDFSGENTWHNEFAERAGASFTPVIKFFKHDGSELVPELLGFNSEHFYGYYLDAKINQSLSRLRLGRPLSHSAY
jgi:thioredoxin-related protein